VTRSIAVRTVIAIVAALSTACNGSPTAPTPAPATWSIAPTSLVMHEGDTAAFRISGPYGGLPGCRLSNDSEVGIFHVTEHLDDWTQPRNEKRPTQATTGECLVTLTTLTRPGRVVFYVFTPGYWLGSWFDTVHIQATIDVVQ